MLFQVLLHLFYAGLSDSQLVNLYRFEGPFDRADWKTVLEGLRSFPPMLQARRRGRNAGS